MAAATRTTGASIRLLSVAYLLVQCVALIVYWAVLFARPDMRAPFLATGAPDVTLMAFALGDLTLYAGSSVASAYGIWRARRWLLPALCLHCGTAMYAALYAIALAVMEPERWLGAAMMAPALIVSPALVWAFRRKDS